MPLSGRTIKTNSAVTGNFGLVSGFDLGEGRRLGQSATSPGIFVVTLAGDADLDLAVGFDDLLALAQNYGTESAATWSRGDFDYDGSVGFEDLLVLAQNYRSDAVSGLVDRVFHHLDAAKLVADEVARQLVVVARHVDDLAALARTAQNLLYHVVVALRPVPLAAQLPAIDDVTHQIQLFARVRLQEGQQRLGLAAGGAEVKVGDEHRAQAPPRGVQCVVAVAVVVGRVRMGQRRRRRRIGSRPGRPQSLQVGVGGKAAAHQAPSRCLR